MCARAKQYICRPALSHPASAHLTLRLFDLQEDAYDAVKTNMFDLLASVASNCQPSQLDMLFAKLERSQARSTQDAERLLTLLERLAESDTQVRAAAAHDSVQQFLHLNQLQGPHQGAKVWHASC